MPAIHVQRLICPTCGAVFRSQFPRCPRDGAALIALERDPLIGAAFADRYVIEDCVGEGGMGRVYRARHQRMSRKFAIKVLYGDHAADPKMRQRFVHEAEAACRLSHRNVISVLDFGETQSEQLYLVMDYVEGRSLARVIAEEAPFGSQRVRNLLRQLCLGLAHAHEQGLVHRDFKGDNVIITADADGELARVVDFGLAVMLDGADQRLTTEGMVLGTPAYMSPEQAVGEELDLRTDLFSLGLVAYEMLAGVLPFQGNPVAVARQNLASEPPLIHERVPGLFVDGYLEQIARKLMAKKPADRYQSAREVIAALDRAQVAEGNATEPMQRAAGRSADTQAQTPAALRKSDARSLLANADTAALDSRESAAVDSRESAAVDSRDSAAVGGRDSAAVGGRDSAALGGRDSAAVGMHDSTVVIQNSAAWWRRALVAVLVLVLIGAGALVVRHLSATSPDSAQARVEAEAREEAVEPQAQPVEPQAQPVEPQAVEPQAQPVEPEAQPVEPEAQAVEPQAQPVEPQAQAVEPDVRGQRPSTGKPSSDTSSSDKPSTSTSSSGESSSSAASGGKPITNATLTALYESVGEDLNRLFDQRGAGATERFRATYRSIPFNDALRTPALRRDAHGKLRSLQRAIRRELKE